MNFILSFLVCCLFFFCFSLLAVSFFPFFFSNLSPLFFSTFGFVYRLTLCVSQCDLFFVASFFLFFFLIFLLFFFSSSSFLCHINLKPFTKLIVCIHVYVPILFVCVLANIPSKSASNL